MAMAHDILRARPHLSRAEELEKTGAADIKSLSGDDSIEGGSGDDNINGGRGDDVINGGDGDDTMTGGKGKDDFVLSEGSDVITDFNPKQDSIEIPASVLPDGDTPEFSQDGNDVVIDLGDHQTIIEDSKVSQVEEKTTLPDFFDKDATLAFVKKEGNVNTFRYNGGSKAETITPTTLPVFITVNYENSSKYFNESNAVIKPGPNDVHSDDIFIINGKGGQDLISGGFSDDSLYGGAGGDNINDNGGNDVIDGEDGNDTLSGGEGDDTISGGAGYDLLYGGGGLDKLNGGAGDDLLHGGTSGIDSRKNTLTGGTGRDRFILSAGNNLLKDFDADDDFLTIDGGLELEDIIHKGPSGVPSTVQVNVKDSNTGRIYQNDIENTTAEEVKIALSSGSNEGPELGKLTTDKLYPSGQPFYKYVGTPSAETITPESLDLENDNKGINYPGSPIRVNASGGADFIEGMSTNDTLDGGAGGDEIYGRGGADIINGDDGSDEIDGGAGGDTIKGNSGKDTILGNDGSDSIFGNEGDDIVDGGAGSDYLNGGKGDDQVGGRAGNDVYQLSLGNDTFWGFKEGDEIIYPDSWSNWNDDYVNEVLSSATSLDATKHTLWGDYKNSIRLTFDVVMDGTTYVNQSVVINTDLDIEDDSPGWEPIPEQESEINGGNGSGGNGGGGNGGGGGGLEDAPGGGGGSGGGSVIDGTPTNNELRVVDVDPYPKKSTFKENIKGSQNNDKVVGGKGIDKLRGFEKNDLLKGKQGADHLYGQQGKDTLIGGNGNDVLQGGNGNDDLEGGSGSDVLYGGHNGDTLTGNNGKDTFILSRGADVITDFNIKKDAIGLVYALNLKFKQKGDDLLIKGDDNVKTLLLDVEKKKFLANQDNFEIVPAVEVNLI